MSSGWAWTEKVGFVSQVDELQRAKHQLISGNAQMLGMMLNKVRRLA
jgi:hypothetical protein